MNWDDVRIFLAVARTGQILAASRRLGLNHATLSRRLTALEKALSEELIASIDPYGRTTPTLGRRKGFFEEFFGNIGTVGGVGTSWA